MFNKRSNNIHFVHSYMYKIKNKQIQQNSLKIVYKLYIYNHFDTHSETFMGASNTWQETS